MTETIRIAVAILDDYQEVSLEMADWSAVRDRASIEVFTETIVDQIGWWRGSLRSTSCASMRERTPLPGSVLERLPRLKLIVSTGPKNASIDQKAAEAHGIAVEKHQGHPDRADGAHLGTDLAARPPSPRRARRANAPVAGSATSARS